MTRGSAAGGADRADGIAGHRAAVTWSLFVAGIPKSARPGTLVISRTTGRPFVRKRNTAWAVRVAEAAQAAPPLALLEGPLVGRYRSAGYVRAATRYHVGLANMRRRRLA